MREAGINTPMLIKNYNILTEDANTGIVDVFYVKRIGNWLVVLENGTF